MSIATKTLEIAATQVGVREHGTPPGFWGKVRLTGNVCECWEWGACKNPKGYGVVKSKDGGTRYAHRVAYQDATRSLLGGMELDHLCRNPGCVNPWHLEQVTREENTARGLLWSVVSNRAARTHCPRGHEFTPENTKVRTSGSRPNPFRECRECIRLSDVQRGRIRA